MIYDLNDPNESIQARERFEKMMQSCKMIELKEKRKKRTIKQNSYLHVCISLFAIELEYTLQEAKTHLKRNCYMMIYQKDGEYFLRSSTDLDTAELTQFIEWIRNYSAGHGCYIPTPEEYIENQFYIDKEISKSQSFL